MRAGRKRPPRGVSLMATDRVSENDRLWFEARPGRQYRARPWVKGESPPWDWGSGEPYTIIRSARPGFRFRAFTGWRGPPLEMAPETILETVWRDLARPDLVVAADGLNTTDNPK